MVVKEDKGAKRENKAKLKLLRMERKSLKIFANKFFNQMDKKDKMESQDKVDQVDYVDLMVWMMAMTMVPM